MAPHLAWIPGPATGRSCPTATAAVAHGQWERRPLFLCAGLQSSGTTLVSWCFLQRRDMDGVLDGYGDILAEIPRHLPVPCTWCKFTITAFRLRDMVMRYEDEGWDVRPLLVIRDVRTVFNSLIAKPYGRNGVTAEEPPLRLRLLRFRDDWELFQSRDWPMIRYESLVSEPEEALGQACAARPAVGPGNAQLAQTARRHRHSL